MKRTCLIGFWLGTAAIASATVGGTVTYYRDVLPVLQNHCQSCHRPGHMAPMSFMTYKETRPWAEAMKYVVMSKQMPPWFAERPYVPTSSHQALKVEEIETIVRWVEMGAPPVYFQETRWGDDARVGRFIPIARR